MSSANESELNSKPHQQLLAEVQNNIKQEILGAPPFLSQIPPWHFTSLVSETLHYLAEKVSSPRRTYFWFMFNF